MEVRYVVIFAVCFLVFYWLLSSFSSIKEAIKSFSIKRWYPVLLSVLGFIIIVCSGFYKPIDYGELHLPITLFGFVIFMAGFNLSLWAKMTMGKSWNFPGAFNKRKQQKLVIEGPYKYTRNPIYLGLFLVGVGSSIVLQSYFLPFMVFYYIFIRYVLIPKEEKSLKEVFGKDYENYSSKTPRLI